MESKEHFHVRFYDDKEVIESFKNLYAARNYLSSKKFIRSWLEIYDSRSKKVVFEVKGGRHIWLD